MEIDSISAVPMVTRKFSLLASRRFLPIFLATFWGTFNDNLVRSGIIVLIAYASTRGLVLPASPEILVTICSGLLVLPMVLFSSLAGQLADKCEKSRLVRYTKIAELAIMLGVGYGFATQNIYLLMALLFLSGTHTTFYIPIKFSILPQHLKKSELMAGNGFMAGGSYLAILLGMIAGGLLALMPGNVISVAAIGIALVGLVASFFIPYADAAHPDAQIDRNLWKGSCDMVKFVLADRMLCKIILVLSWFLLLSSVFIAQFANYAGMVMRASNEVYILFLTLFSMGVAVGSLLCDNLLKGDISARFTSIAALGVSIFTIIMVLATPVPQHEGMVSLQEFIGNPAHWLLLFSMFMIALCGGIYMVPLYASLQHRADVQYRSRVVAASNLSDSIFMTLAAIASAVLLYAGVGIQGLFIIVACLTLVVAWYARKLT
jgi:acyl-[acyl-carrier-protein]-phospholipid O-acyltransferase / long-chain-fatty-acid--[acyl-carrier-protein] ligase